VVICISILNPSVNDLAVEVVGMVEQFSDRAIAIEAGTFYKGQSRSQLPETGVD